MEYGDTQVVSAHRRVPSVLVLDERIGRNCAVPGWRVRLGQTVQGYQDRFIESSARVFRE
jgi:hypothetical protein